MPDFDTIVFAAAIVVVLWSLARGQAFQEAIQSIFGGRPEMRYFEAPIVIDNETKRVLDEAA